MDYLPIECGNKVLQLSLPIVIMYICNLYIYLSVDLSYFSKLNSLAFDEVRIGFEMYAFEKNENLKRCIGSGWDGVPRKWLDITCWWEVGNKSFCFSLLPYGLCFSLLTYLYLNPWGLHLIFSPCPAEEGDWESGLAAPDGQPRSTHHKRKTHFYSEL